MVEMKGAGTPFVLFEKKNDSRAVLDGVYSLIMYMTMMDPVCLKRAGMSEWWRGFVGGDSRPPGMEALDFLD